MGKEAKTNAMRILERAKVPYTAHEYAHEEGVAVDGVTVAASMGEDPACVYKTLVTQGSSKNYFVFVIPVAAELDLKAAARSVGEKSVAMIHVADINKITGYVRGGCSPVGMKKQYTTVFDESVLAQEKVYVSGGRIGTQVCCPPTSSGQQGQQQRRSSSKVKRPYCQRNDGEAVQSGACSVR
jgi:Cys-tRNA(Pro)/Cys-tRNA(Cys) deacylase